MSDSDSDSEGEAIVPRIDLDYGEIMEGGVFPKIDYEIYCELQERKKGPVDSDDEDFSEDEDEPEPFDFEAFLEDYNPYGIQNEDELEEFQNRVRYVHTLGIYGGERHPDSNEREGRGRATFANGDEYSGQYHEGLKHGSGTYWFRSRGISDDDQMIQDEIDRAPSSVRQLIKSTHFVEAAKKLRSRLSKRESEPVSLLRIRFVIEYGPQPFYIGDFVADSRHGNGIMKYFNGSFYKGEWENGKRHGNGEMVYPNSDTYRGEWKEGHKHGDGTYQFKKLGVSYTGAWVEGQMVKGVWRMNDGTVYDGSFEGNMPSGEGMFRYRDNVAIRGRFENLEWQPSFQFVKTE